jgi:hypothetical protein
MPILLSLNAPIKIRVIYCTVYLIFCWYLLMSI